MTAKLGLISLSINRLSWILSHLQQLISKIGQKLALELRPPEASKEKEKMKGYVLNFKNYPITQRVTFRFSNEDSTKILLLSERYFEHILSVGREPQWDGSAIQIFWSWQN